MPLSSVDLLAQLRAALDELETLLAGYIVDIEMSRVRVLADPDLFRREFSLLIESAVADGAPTGSITVRVTRTGKAAAIEVVNEHAGDGTDRVIRSTTVPLAPGASNAADA
jgi:hypothetical protein